MRFLTWLKRPHKLFRIFRLLHEGNEHFEAARYRAAREAFEKALALCVAARDEFGISTMAMNLAMADYHLSDYRNATRYGRIALRLSRRLGDRDGMVRSLGILGNVDERRGALARALARQQRAYALALELGKGKPLLIASGNLAQALTLLGRYSEAMTAIDRVLELMKERGETHGPLYLMGLNIRGATYRGAGEHELADETFEHLRQQAVDEKNKMAESLAVTNLAIGYLGRGRLEEAAAELRRNVELKRSMEDYRGAVVAMLNLGRCLTELGRLDEALGILEEARGITEPLGFRQGEWMAHGASSRVLLLQGRLQEAHRAAERSVAMAQEFGGPQHVAEMQRALSLVLIALGDHANAAAALSSSIAAGETVRANMQDADSFRVSLLESHIAAYHDLQWVLAATGNPEGALEVAERGRARALSDALARQTARLDPPPDLGSIRMLAAALQTTFVVHSIVAEPLSRYGPKTDIELFTWVVPRSIDSPIVFHRSGSLAALLASGELHIPSDSSAEKDDGEYFVLHNDPAVVERELRLQHEVLIAPIAHALPADPEELVTLIPNGPLIVTPFAALTDAEGKRLVERHTLAVAPSMQTLLLTRNLRPGRGSGALVVGNPNRPELKTLPGTRAEALALARRFGSHPLIRAAATHEAVIAAMPGKRLLHFGCHGAFDPDDRPGLHGALLLTGGDLTAAEIAQMKLDADLAVLSACDTGQGRIAADGLLGLSRAFLLAGVPRVIATLWPIDDRPTPILMKELYDHLDAAGAASALRHAMLTTIADGYPEPRYWAAFMLIGHR